MTASLWEGICICNSEVVCNSVLSFVGREFEVVACRGTLMVGHLFSTSFKEDRRVSSSRILRETARWF